jgi:hypothetical protein
VRARAVLLAAARCAAATVVLLARRNLHITRARVGRTIRLPDGRAFVVFRETSRDDQTGAAPVVLSVWYELRGVGARARVRQWLFERESILNTFLFAGFAGYQRKLWMIDRATGRYAGLYSWRSAAEADTYARYITAVLRPLSVAGSVGFDIRTDLTLTDHLAGQ